VPLQVSACVPQSDFSSAATKYTSVTYRRKPSAIVDKHDGDGWDHCIQVNLSGTFYMTRRALPMLRKSGGGAIRAVTETEGLFSWLE